MTNNYEVVLKYNFISLKTLLISPKSHSNEYNPVVDVPKI